MWQRRACDPCVGHVTTPSTWTTPGDDTKLHFVLFIVECGPLIIFGSLSFSGNLPLTWDDTGAGSLRRHRLPVSAGEGWPSDRERAELAVWHALQETLAGCQTAGRCRTVPRGGDRSVGRVIGGGGAGLLRELLQRGTAWFRIRKYDLGALFTK